MKKNLKNIMRHVILGSMGLVTFAACNPEPDESDLYTFTGETIESFIAKDSTLTAFNYILSRVDYDKMMATYGSYTCFAPNNDGVYEYIDSLYNDTEAGILHNGMEKPVDATYGDNAYASLPAEERLKWLSDSLCLNIAKFHITTTYRNLVSMTGSTKPIYTMLGRIIKISSETGQVVLGDKATIISSDNEAVNGLVHIVDHVVPRTDVSFPTLFERHQNEFSIFAEALKRTGLMDSILTETRGEMEFKQMAREGQETIGKIYPAEGVGSTGKMECKEGYTIFAESDEVFKANGINNINDLIAYANKEYGGATEWYDYLREKKMTVRTDDKYTERNNALNMFVAYHIINAKISDDWLVYEKGAKYWNYAPDADPHDYYETLLPHTIMKIWEPLDVGSGKTLFINRYQTFNSLTDKLPYPITGEKSTIHEVKNRGIMINRRVKPSLEADNGWVHYIDGLLVYNSDVPKKVLNERMRVNCTSLFPELITNDLRSIERNDGRIPSGYNEQRHGIPSHYFKNMIHYNDNVCLVYCVHNEMRNWQADQMQFWGTYDLAFKLPSVPSGVYEIRVVYAPMSYGSFMQYYIGTSSSVSSMLPIGLPFDATVPVEDPRVGLTNPGEEDDMGIATDIAMHNRGFMRGPFSYCGHPENGWSITNNGRFEWGNAMTVRYVLGRVDLKQGNENWLRIKTLTTDRSTNPVGLDFVELVPTSVVDNQRYAEDWY